MTISIEVTLYANHADSDRLNSNIRFNGEAETVEDAKKMALELHQLSEAIGAMQAPRPEPRPALEKMKAALEEKAAREQVPNDQPKSTDTTSGEPSAQTGESSSPALDYAKDVKPITIQLSKEKGREITIGVLSRFGVKSAQDLEPAQWTEYIAHCGKVLAGGEV